MCKYLTKVHDYYLLSGLFSGELSISFIMAKNMIIPSDMLIKINIKDVTIK